MPPTGIIGKHSEWRILAAGIESTEFQPRQATRVNRTREPGKLFSLSHHHRSYE